MQNRIATLARGARRLALAGALVSMVPASGLGAQVQWSPVRAGMPQTAAELNGFTAHTRHLEMWDYLTGLSANSTSMRLGTYGETREGRELAYAVFSKPLLAEPWEAMALGRPIVVLAANVHGGERTFREGLLVLMRDLATPGTAANNLLDRVTVVVAPQINPDGFEASLNGQRGNSWDIDLNRDYVKLEHPSIRNYIQNVIGAWRPHMFVDGHNGGSRPYNLNYQCPSHADPALEITLLCDQEVFPAIDAMLEAEGLKSWYYTGGNAEEWRVGGSQARIGRNYGGFINSVGILFEAPSQELEVGARAGYLGYLAVVKYAAENPDRLMNTVAAANAETVAMGSMPGSTVTTSMEYAAEEYPVSYEIMGDDGNPVQVTGARLMKRPVVLTTRERPWAYTLPRDAVDAVAMLRRHGITVEQLREEAVLNVQAYKVGDITYSAQYNHAAVTQVEVAGVMMIEQTLDAGTYIIPTGQNLGRLVGHMMEVETEDNVVYWNTMDAWIPREGGTMYGSGNFRERPRSDLPLLPIYKIMAPVNLNTRIVDTVWR